MKSFITSLVWAVALVGCESQPTRTSAHASPHEVTFLALPKSASDIQYWDDGHNKIARFKTSESDFRSLFSSKQFIEITEPTQYVSNVFGDPSNRPSGLSTAKTGLVYQLIKGDGGGETIIFDRDTGVGSYDFAPW